MAYSENVYVLLILEQSLRLLYIDIYNQSYIHSRIA